MSWWTWFSCTQAHVARSLTSWQSLKPSPSSSLHTIIVCVCLSVWSGAYVHNVLCRFRVWPRVILPARRYARALCVISNPDLMTVHHSLCKVKWQKYRSDIKRYWKYDVIRKIRNTYRIATPSEEDRVTATATCIKMVTFSRAVFELCKQTHTDKQTIIFHNPSAAM